VKCIGHQHHAAEQDQPIKRRGFPGGGKEKGHENGSPSLFVKIEIKVTNVAEGIPTERPKGGEI